MPKPLVFMMGRSPVFLPTDRRYAKNHMWVARAEGGCRFGFSAYAVRLLGDVRHIEWSVVPGQVLGEGQPIGFIEASKATSDLYAPASGTLVEINHHVLDDPSLINSHLYDLGWLLALDPRDSRFLSPREYLSHLEACWPLAQRLLKGQAGRGQPTGNSGY